MMFRERIFSFRSRQFMEAVHEYYAREDWMWDNNQRGQGIETFIWNKYFDPDRDLFWPFQLEQGDEFFEIFGPRWYAMGGKPLTWCTYSTGMFCEESSTAHYGFREWAGEETLTELPF